MRVNNDLTISAVVRRCEAAPQSFYEDPVTTASLRLRLY
jgi:hypothetical protein